MEDGRGVIHVPILLVARQTEESPLAVLDNAMSGQSILANLLRRVGPERVAVFGLRAEVETTEAGKFGFWVLWPLGRGAARPRLCPRLPD